MIATSYLVNCTSIYRRKTKNIKAVVFLPINIRENNTCQTFSVEP